MKIGVVGSRGFNNYKLLKDTLDKYLSEATVIVSGGAKGADSLGERWANENGLETLIHLPNWDKHGKSAGFLRNYKIIEDSNIIIAFWDGLSRGTEHTIYNARAEDKEVIIVYFNKVI